MLGGRLWHAACQAANADLPESLPLAFAGAGEYIRAFEPLLFEEAREAVRGGWAEAAEAGCSWQTDVTSCALQQNQSLGSIQARMGGRPPRPAAAGRPT